MEGEEKPAGGETPPQPNEDARLNPRHIRTMASDLVARESQEPALPHPPVLQEKTKITKTPVLVLLGILILLAGGITYAFRAYRSLLWGGGPPLVERPEAPAPFFGVEATQTLTITDANRSEFSSLLSAAFSGDEMRTGAFKRVAIAIKTETEDRYAELRDLFSLFSIPTPSLFFTAIGRPLMTFAYYGPDGPHFGFATAVEDRERTADAMSRWEETLASDFTPLFLGGNILPAAGVFETYTYKNTAYRFLASPQDPGRGVAYMIFPAGNYLVVTTSRDSMENVIKRLFEPL